MPLQKMSFFIFIILIFSIDTTVCNLLSYVNGVKIRYEVTRFGTYTKTPVSSELVSLFNITLSECLYQCIIRPKCEGLNFLNTITLCGLVSGNGDLEMSSNCLYIKRGDIVTESPTCNGECDGETCDQNGKCVVQEKLECQYPNVVNGKPLGNKYGVGDTQIIRCDSGFTVHGSSTLKCMENKTWDTIPECWKDCDASAVHNANVEYFKNVSGSYVVVRCLEEYISNSSISRADAITMETVGCAKDGSWISSIDCIYIDNFLNIALNKPTSQSSTHTSAVSGESDKAIDGIWDPDFSAGSCSHTGVRDDNVSWWEVNLQQTYIIRRLKILNRQSDYSARKLKQVTVTIGNFSNPTDICAVYDGPASPKEKLELDCNEAIIGQFVRLSKPDNSFSNNLALCEVGIYEN